MIRRLLTFAVLAGLLVAATVWLADRPGSVTLRWEGWRVDTTVPVLVLAVLALIAVVNTLFRLAGAVVAGPGRFLAGRRVRRTEAGFRALSDGMAALAAGNSREARKLAKRADRLLADSSLTALLSAQVAGGPEAERHYQRLAERPETAVLGLKGLTDIAMKQGERAKALEFAARAWSLGGTVDGLAATLFDLQAGAGQWTEAEATLAEAKRRKLLSGADLLHRQALVALERAIQAERDGKGAAALEFALAAHRADPILVPAAVKAAAALHRAGKTRKAESVLAATWEAQPHPDLIEAALALAPMEPALDKVKRVEKLVRLAPDSACGHAALAEVALAAKLWGQARTHLEKAAELRPSAGLYILLARLEREEKGDENAARDWLMKAAGAAAEPAWTCQACAKPADSWSALCPTCGAVDSLAWR
jgi:HemY protein